MKQIAGRLKKSWKWAAPVAALGMLALAGCPNSSSGGPVGGGTGGSGTPITPAQLAGTYRQVQVETSTGQQESVACPGQLTSIQESCGANDQVTFNADGTLSYSETGQPAVPGTFTISGSTLTVKSGTTTTSFVLTLFDDTLTLRELTYNDTTDPNSRTDGVVLTYLQQSIGTP